jgi:hypothetical protein
MAMGTAAKRATDVVTGTAGEPVSDEAILG